MRRLTSIVAVNGDGAIGAGNALPWRVRSDLRFFRETTQDHVVIMGRKTFDSLGKPLPRRQNIIVTHRFGLFVQTPDCHSVGSITEALVLAERLTPRRGEAFVVGGASMYEQFAPYVDRYLITEVDKPVPHADTYFDHKIFGEMGRWQCRRILEGQADGEHDEADFRVFECVARASAEYADRRASAIAAHEYKRSNGRTESNLLRQFA